VRGIDFGVKSVGDRQQSENLYVLGQKTVHRESHRLICLLKIFTLVIVLNLATETVLKRVHFLVCPCGTIPRYFLKVSKIVLSDQVHLEQNLLNFLLYSAHTFILLGAMEISSIVADNHRDSCFLMCSRAILFLVISY